MGSHTGKATILKSMSGIDGLSEYMGYMKSLDAFLFFVRPTAPPCRKELG